MDRRKLEFFKHFSIVIAIYVWFLIILWFVPQYDLIGKISWTFFILMLLHFSYKTLDLVVKVERQLKEEKEQWDNGKARMQEIIQIHLRYLYEGCKLLGD